MQELPIKQKEIVSSILNLNDTIYNTYETYSKIIDEGTTALINLINSAIDLQYPTHQYL